MLRLLAIVGILLAIVGLFNLSQAWMKWNTIRGGLEGWTRAPATVVRVYKEFVTGRAGVDGVRQNGSRWHVVFTFADASNRALTFDRALPFVNDRSDPFASGEAIEVVYPPSHPERALINWQPDLANEVSSRAIVGGFFLVAGAMMAASGIAMTKLNRR